MLTDLIIKNFAIIDRLHVGFGGGFNVLTGETGAGKSIIIDAVNLLLGSRARPDLIRNGETEATVEAVFDISGHPDLGSDLEEAGFEGGGELLVKRVVSSAGKNRVYLNGSMATLGQLQGFASRLVSIYGQHENQHLLRVETHLPLLDAFAGHGELLDRCGACHRELSGIRERLARLDEAERDRKQRLDLLEYQSREIGEAAPRPGEDEDLEAERLLLHNAERLASATGGGYDTLYGGDRAVCERLAEVAAELEGLAGIDPELGTLGETVRSALYSLEDAAEQLRDYAGRISFEPERLDGLEQRLALLSRLKRKYGATLEQVLTLKAQIETELEQLGDIEGSREKLLQSLGEAEQMLAIASSALTQGRAGAAQRLTQAVETELQDLAMPRARFLVRFSPLSQPGAKGAEKGEFFLAPNPGEEPKPLARIASGGELSRIMLALKRAMPDPGGVSTLIFDEVDAGIGGAAATAVGEKLHRVAEGAQVLCITHLPQVAAYADGHFRVEKREEGGRTATRVIVLDKEEQVQEMARMLGGARVTDRTLEHARELIAHSARV